MTEQDDISVFVVKAHSDGMTIIETIKAVRERFSIGLGEAKEIVGSQPCWKLIVESSASLHEEAIREVTGSSDPSPTQSKP